jgi:hypothetical protein
MSKKKITSSLLSTAELNKTTTVKVELSGRYSKKRNASDYNVKEKVQQSNGNMSGKLIRVSVSPLIKKVNPMIGSLSVSLYNIGVYEEEK